MPTRGRKQAHLGTHSVPPEQRGGATETNQGGGPSDEGKGNGKHTKEGSHSLMNTKGKGSQTNWSGETDINPATWIPRKQNVEGRKRRPGKNLAAKSQDSRSPGKQNRTDNLGTAGKGSPGDRRRPAIPSEQDADATALLTGVQKIKKRKLGMGQNRKNIEMDPTKLIKRAQGLKRELHTTNRQLQRYVSVKAIVVAARDKEQAVEQAPPREMSEKTGDPDATEHWTKRKASGSTIRRARGRQNATESFKSAGTPGRRRSTGTRKQGAQSNHVYGRLCTIPQLRQDESSQNAEHQQTQHMSTGNKGETDLAIQHIAINKRNAAFSEEELIFFREAIGRAHTSQTHFADPGASFCYRCPICHRVVNWENLPEGVRMHFTMMRRAKTAYHITINNRASPLQIIRSPNAGKVREGGAPPSADFIGRSSPELPTATLTTINVGKSRRTEEPARPSKRSEEELIVISPEDSG